MSFLYNFADDNTTTVLEKDIVSLKKLFKIKQKLQYNGSEITS